MAPLSLAPDQPAETQRLGLDPGHALRALAGEATTQSLDVVPEGTHQLPSHPEGLSWVCGWKERAAIDTPHHQGPGSSIPSGGLCAFNVQWHLLQVHEASMITSFYS